MKLQISPSSIDFNEILADLNNFVVAHPDASKWEEYFAGGVGQTLLELMAGVSTYFAYQNIVGRRECYFQNAQNRSSIIGAAEYLGYSIFRGSNAKVKLTVLPTVNLTLPAFSIVGSYESYDLVTEREITFQMGIPVTFVAVVGTLQSVSITSTTAELNIFRFFQANISENIQIVVDGAVAKHSKVIKELSEVTFVVLSNPYESVDLFSLNLATNPPLYSFNSTITVNYIELDEFIVDPDTVIFNYGAITSSEVDSIYLPPESNTSIKVRAPLYFETQFTIRGRDDVEKMVILFSPYILDAKGHDISPAIISIAILKRDTSALTQAERSELNYKFEQIRQFGMMPPIFVDSIRVPVTVKVRISLNPPVPTNLNEQIIAILAEYEKVLGAHLSFQDIEMAVEDLDGVKIARVSLGGGSWVASASYQLGQTSDNGKNIQQVLEILYKSGATEPVWPIVINEPIIDNGLMWKTEAMGTPPPTAIWAPSTVFKLDQAVMPTTPNGYQYKVIELLNYSGSTEPAWPGESNQAMSTLVGTLIYDNNLMWFTVEREGQQDGWQADTRYKIGDIVIATDDVATDTENLMFQVVGYLGTSGATEPTWTDTLATTYVDNTLLWKTVPEEVVPLKLNYNEYYIINKVIETTL